MTDIDVIKEKKVMTVDGMTVVVEDVQENGNGKVESIILEVDNCCLIGCKKILTPKGVTVGAAWYRFLDKRASGNPEDDDVPSRYIKCAVKVARGIFGIRRFEARHRQRNKFLQARLI